MGQLKARIFPEDITINLSEDAQVPLLITPRPQPSLTLTFSEDAQVPQRLPDILLALALALTLSPALALTPIPALTLPSP